MQAEGDTAARPAAREALRVMTFNIRYGTADDGEHSWRFRRDLALHAIRDFAPAVLGVQEALRFQLDEIAEELGQFGEVGVGRDDGVEAGEYSAILFDSARLEPLDEGTVWLSDSPEAPGSTSWGNRIPRIVTWARFRDLEAGGTFYVFNTHWDHESQPSRERSAEFILERIRTRTVSADPVILMGDFNAGEDNAAFRALLDGRPVGGPEPEDGDNLFDTFRAVHPDAGQVGTFNAFRGERTGAKIDAVLASAGWRVLDANIVRLREGGLFPSDHDPVTATLTRERLTPDRRSP